MALAQRKGGGGNCRLKSGFFGLVNILSLAVVSDAPIASASDDFIASLSQRLNRLVDLRMRPGDGLYEKTCAALLVAGINQKAERQLLAARLLPTYLIATH